MSAKPPAPLVLPSIPAMNPSWMAGKGPRPPIPVNAPALADAVAMAPLRPGPLDAANLDFLCRRITDLEKRLGALTGLEERLMARMETGFTALSQELKKTTRSVEEAIPKPISVPKVVPPNPWTPALLPGGAPAVAEPAIMRSEGGADGTVILLVDDDAMVRRVTSVMLQKVGYTVDTANSGTAALEALRETSARYGLVMLDLSMPGLTGEQTYRKMVDAKHDFPVLFYSGYSYQLAELFARYGGARTEFLLKPFESAQLAERVARVLPVPARRMAAVTAPTPTAASTPPETDTPAPELTVKKTDRADLPERTEKEKKTTAIPAAEAPEPDTKPVPPAVALPGEEPAAAAGKTAATSAEAESESAEPFRGVRNVSGARTRPSPFAGRLKKETSATAPAATADV